MLLQLMAPMASHSAPSGLVLEEELYVEHTLPENLEHGHDLGGQNIDLEGMTEVLVRQDSSIDMWMSELLVSGDSNNLSTPNGYFAENGSSYFCWMNDLGEVRMGVRTSSGAFSNSLVDTVDASLGLIGCSIVVDKTYRPLALFGDGADLKMGRLAFEGQVYSTDTWLERTIIEDLYPESMIVRLTPVSYTHLTLPTT